MARKRITGSEPIASGGASPARTERTKLHATRTKEAAPEPSTLEANSQGANGPDSEAVALLAYSYWEARGFQGGSPEEDWLRAEQELSRGLAASAKA